MDLDQVQAFVEESLPNHMCPANWIQVDEFPLTQNGKLDLDYLDQLHSENKKIPNNKDLSAQPSSKTNIPKYFPFLNNLTGIIFKDKIFSFLNKS